MRFLLIGLLLIACSTNNQRGIDRLALVTRHNVTVTQPDSLGSLSVGNGEFTFTVDVSGLQSFPASYENGIPLGTQSQWAWHAFPNTRNYSLSDVSEYFESCDGTKAPYPVQRSEDAASFLRSNPHRLHLAQIGLIIKKENGDIATITDLTNIHQQLDLWNGRIESKYDIEGTPVKVTLYALQDDDGISARIESPLLSNGRLKPFVKFPYAKDCHTCPGYDWSNEDKHTSTLDSTSSNFATISRIIDSTRYFSNITWSSGELTQNGRHQFEVANSEQSLDFSVTFSRDRRPYAVEHEQVSSYNKQHWTNFWTGGGAIDFSRCTDPRAPELERRVVLSQYLTKIQCSGSLPPQETGLTMNSWYGKFHLEMHWWHATHFALWNRASLMNRSLDWYRSALDPARSTATRQGYKGARWPKMTDPDAKESPSDVGAFIIWQQPHPVYMAELMYRDTPDKVILDRYSDVVFATADFMASFVKMRASSENKGSDNYHLCHPLMPAQEIFPATGTDDPAFELQYWKYALTVAQQWRKRLELPENEEWNDVIKKLAPLPIADGIYLPNTTTPGAYKDDRFRRDHPSVLAALGVLPADERLDSKVMLNTFNNIVGKWQWETTWGWDYPMMAMTAARLNEPAKAIDALMMDVPKNTYLANGHNYQDKTLRLYLPGNGGLLTAVAMMAAGWDGSETENPGFPKDGTWDVQWERLNKMP